MFLWRRIVFKGHLFYYFLLLLFYKKYLLCEHLEVCIMVQSPSQPLSCEEYFLWRHTCKSRQGRAQPAMTEFIIRPLLRLIASPLGPHKITGHVPLSETIKWKAVDRTAPSGHWWSSWWPESNFQLLAYPTQKALLLEFQISVNAHRRCERLNRHA